MTETTTAAEGDGWTMDNEPKTVTVTVTDNGEGQLVAEVSGATINNSYKAADVTVDDKDAEGNALATKVVAGTGFAAKDFAFTIAAGENTAGVETPMPEAAAGSAS